MIEKNEIEFPTYFDNSMLEAHKTCPRKGYYQYFRHLAPRAKSVHLIAGAAFAKGLEVTRKAFYTEDSPTFNNLDDSLQIGIPALLNEYGDFYPENSPKTPERVVEALVEYFQIWNPATDYIQPHRMSDNKPAVEMSFALPLGVLHPVTGEEILYVGRYDLLGEKDKSLWVVDEKTASRLGESWRKQWELRSQFTGYCWAAREYGYPVVGAVVRGISFLKYKFGSEEAITFRPDHMIDDWLKSTRAYIEMLKYHWAREFYPQELGSACAQYSGCEYQVLCSRRNPEDWIADNFAISKWDPLERISVTEV